MNLNEKFATSINQGKELIDIGIDPSTADLCWTNESYYSIYAYDVKKRKEIDYSISFLFNLIK
jgi:hypothetical protein